MPEAFQQCQRISNSSMRNTSGPPVAGAACGGFGFARSTTTLDIFNWLQVTANFGDVPLLQSAPNRPNYIDVWALWLHGHDL